MRNIKKVWRLIAVMVIGMMLLASTACTENVDSQGVEDTVKNFLEAVKKGDVEKASGYLEDADQVMKFSDEGQEKRVKMVLEKMTYENPEIESADKETSLVKVKIKAPDMQKVSPEIFTKLLQKMTEEDSNQKDNDPDAMEALMDETFLEELSNPELLYVTQEVDMDLVKNGEVWKIKGTQKVRDAITGNFFNWNGE